MRAAAERVIGSPGPPDDPVVATEWQGLQAHSEKPTDAAGAGGGGLVLGVPASEMAGRIVALEDLWGDVAVRRLCARLGDARDTAGAAAVLESAIAERIASANGSGRAAALPARSSRWLPPRG